MVETESDFDWSETWRTAKVLDRLLSLRYCWISLTTSADSISMDIVTYYHVSQLWNRKGLIFVRQSVVTDFHIIMTESECNKLGPWQLTGVQQYNSTRNHRIYSLGNTCLCRRS